MKHIITSVARALCVAAVSAVAFTGCLSTSTTSSGAVGANRSQFMLYSEEEVEESANAAYEEVLAEAKSAGTLNTNAATTKRVQAIANRLIAQTGTFREDALSWDWQVNVITDDTINAWCMAGGKIVVYTGIIETLDLTDAQLAAVMGHEIAHALREHSREQASRAAITTTGVSVLSSVTGLGDTGATAMSALAQYTLTLPFSRSHETEADEIGTELMARAGYDPNEAVNIWKKMSALTSSSVPEIMSTHPSNESRIKNLESLMPKVYPLYTAATGK